MRRIVVLPAILIGCLIVIWVGTVAAAKMPDQDTLAPTLTASAQTGFNAKTAQQDAANQPFESASCSLSEQYPNEILQWCGLIEEAAHETNLPAALIASVMLQESGGDPSAYSSSGAVGLMQVMPKDGLAADFMCINGPCFADRPTIEELQNPQFNIAYGSRLLADLFATHGSYREALFRYGPSNMGYRYADLVLSIWENYQ